MTAPAAVSWGARLGSLNLQGTPLAFLGAAATPWIFSAAAIGELVHDKLPRTGSRKAPAPFIVRVVMGAVCGGALVSTRHELAAGLVAGAAGAVAGTLGRLRVSSEAGAGDRR